MEPMPLMGMRLPKMGVTDPQVNPQMGVIEAPLFMERLPMRGMDHPPAPGPALHRLAFKMKW